MLAIVLAYFKFNFRILKIEINFCFVIDSFVSSKLKSQDFHWGTIQFEGLVTDKVQGEGYHIPIYVLNTPVGVISNKSEIYFNLKIPFEMFFRLDQVILVKANNG